MKYTIVIKEQNNTENESLELSHWDKTSTNQSSKSPRAIPASAHAKQNSPKVTDLNQSLSPHPIRSFVSSNQLISLVSLLGKPKSPTAYTPTDMLLRLRSREIRMCSWDPAIIFGSYYLFGNHVSFERPNFITPAHLEVNCESSHSNSL